ncbi:hypothetical protein LTR08_000034 [Meristemomyces frigidus]|nr:hypothetical protein LTR08_000034 [Meristemomyces frigidus]
MYPGHTAEEIQAFEHYKHKARRVSEEGYGERRKSGDGDAPKAGSKAFVGMQPYRTIPAQAPQPMIIMAKRSGRTHCVEKDVSSTCGAETSAATFAPFSSPRTPARKSEIGDTVLKTIRAPAAYRDMTPERSRSASPVKRKAADWQGNLDAPLNTHASERNGKGGLERVEDVYITDLRDLPHVRLVHPQLASLPRSHDQRRMGELSRKCSLGCEREGRTGRCVETKEAIGNAHSRPTLFHDAADTPAAAQKSDIVDYFFSLARYLLGVGKSVHLPKSGMLDALTSASATPQQKVDALKALVTLTGQGLVLLMVVTMLWRLGAAVMYVFEVLLWPLAVPFRILAWLAGFA